MDSPIELSVLAWQHFEMETLRYIHIYIILWSCKIVQVLFFILYVIINSARRCCQALQYIQVWFLVIGS